MKSHMQMPKCVLKQFTIKEGTLKNKLYLYDFNTKDFRVSTPDGVNTCEGGYRDEVENELSGKIESPLGRLIAFVKSEEFEKQHFSLSKNLNEAIYNYIYALIARSPQMLQQVKEQSIFSDLYTEQDFRSLTVLMGLITANEENLFKKYTPTFFINNSNEPFILPLCGAYDMQKSNGEQLIQLPITEKVAIRMIDNRFLNNYINDSKLVRLSSSNDKVIQQFNHIAYLVQQRKGNGVLIASNKSALENAMNYQ